MRVTVEHPENRDAVLVLCEQEDGTVLANDEPASREQVEDVLETCELYVRELKDNLLRTCGAPGVLVHLKRNGFFEPDCEGGYSFAEEPSVSLGQPVFGGTDGFSSPGDGGWLLEVSVRYEHHDDRGGQFEHCGDFYVKDGRFYCEDRDLADANDFEACSAAVSEEFWTDGG